MYITIQNILLIGSILLFLGIVAGQSSYKFGVPTLIFFLAIGMLAGSEGIGGIVFDNVATSKFIGIVALNFILFSGGMDTKWRSIKPIFWQGVSLSTLGVILTAFAVGWFVYLISDFSFLEGLLLGSIVASTDAAAVFSILRSNNLSLRNNLKPTLEMESGSNDPVAYLLMILFLNLLTDPGSSPWYFIPKFLLQIGLGALMGYIMGKITTLSVNKIKTGYTGLYPVLVVALMLFTYSFTDKLGGNGFLSVYIAAVYFGNQKTVHREIINSTLDGFAWLMQIVLFLTLGLQVFPTHVWAILGIGIAISAFLIFVARPLAVFVALSFSKVTFRSKMFISWVGLRGAAPIVFAMYPLMAGIEKANMIFNIVFFISFTSMVLQGSTLPMVARWLKVSLILPKSLLSRKEIDTKTELIEIVVPEHSILSNKPLININFPEDTRITMIRRGEEYLVPNGSTHLEPKDHLFILCKNSEQLRCFNPTWFGDEAV